MRDRTAGRPAASGSGNGAFRRLEERLEGRRHSAVHAAVTDLAAGQLMGNGLIETVTVGSG
jgi:hypothetical protein